MRLAIGILIVIGIWMAPRIFVSWRTSRLTKKLSQPGPHNNWRRENRGREESSFDESGSGFGGFGGDY